MSRLNFIVENTSPGSQARAGRFQTLHGEVLTPVFMPVGTQATVKGQTVETLKSSGAQVILANTYHLLLRPGAEVFKHFGGIHRFMNWPGPVLTDSGGFQIFSLPHAREIGEEGARFQSYVDGKTHLLSPESSIAMQQAIGSDIMMVLDQCIPSTASHDEAKAAMELTHRWAERSLKARGDSRQALFGIVQGACHRDLRERSAAFLRELPFDGLAIGGLAVGESHRERYDMTAFVTDHLPKTLPRYLMGVGTPIDILEAVHRGVDMFDCIIPSQLAQRGAAFTSKGKLQLRRTAYRFAEAPLDDDCDCRTCAQHSRAYIHHLIKAGEGLGWHLLAYHNMVFYHRLTREIRESILSGRFLEYYQSRQAALRNTDTAGPGRKPKPMKIAKAPSLGDYEVYKSPHGFFSIRQKSSGEIMHSVTAPSEEANKLYIEQSQLAARLTELKADSAALVVWDVGLGAASNVMAAIHCFERCFEESELKELRPLRLVSFERDLDPLRLAVKHAASFPHLYHSAPSRLLSHGEWMHQSGLLHWQLSTGDFSARIESAPVPSLIFYDPFSYKTDAALWTREVFAKIFAHCEGRSTELYTYSTSTAVRVALLAAGFFVAKGAATGPKTDTTVAFTTLESAHDHPLHPPLLDAAWLSRWRRSHAKFPAGLPSEMHARFENVIEQHRQFSER